MLVFMEGTSPIIIFRDLFLHDVCNLDSVKVDIEIFSKMCIEKTKENIQTSNDVNFNYPQVVFG